MTGFVLAVAALLGVLIGSFLNVVAYRVPAGLSVVRPPSACPGCGSGIAPRDNVPVLSWLLLRGACRGCGMRISARYPLVEAGTAIAFLIAALPFAVQLGAVTDPRLAAATGLELVAFLYLAAISVVLAVIDLDVRRLPDRIVLPAYAIGAALLVPSAVLRGEPSTLLWAAGGAAGAFLFYLVLHVVRPDGMGFGDVKLAGVLGLFLGYIGAPQLVVGIAAGFLLGGVFGVLLMVFRRAGRKTGIPYGPWMLAGAWLGILAGEPLAHAYLALFGLA